jgi:hypothetical protein
MCLAGASGAGAELLAAMPDALLHAHYVWVPMLPSDTQVAALVASERFAEQRATHYWDAERRLARRMGRALGIGPGEAISDGKIEMAWDVYLAYGKGAKEMEKPDFWMHQLGVKHAPRLDAGEWRRRMGQLVVTT